MTGPARTPVIDVVAALARRGDRWLLARRRADDPLGPVWEFPGGKVEPGETPAAALARELREELGIEVAAGRCVAAIEHDLPARRIRLHFMTCEPFADEPRGLEGQEVGWWRLDELEALELAPADRAFLPRLRELMERGDG